MTQTKKRPSCLLLGYGGAGNTGADARIITIVDDVRRVMGGDVRITVATQNREKTLRLVPETEHLQVVQIPHVFFRKVRQLAASHDITILVEGSTFKQNWSSALLHAYLWAAWCAKRAGKKCVAYAVDVGELSPLNRLLTRKVANRIDLLITRSEAARQRLREMGVVRPISANADTAFEFLLGECAAAPLSSRPVVGIAPIEFFQWPVRMKLFGRRETCYHWPFYFSWDRDRQARSEQMAGNFRSLVSHCVDRHGFDVALIAMEELDTRFCQTIANRLAGQHRAHTQVVTSKTKNSLEMVPLLRGLDYLVTARYHASVLSMRTPVPQMAVCHDERIRTIYQEIGIDKDFLLDYRDADLATKLLPTFDRLVRCRQEQLSLLRSKHDQFYLPLCEQNRLDLADWARRHFALPPQRQPAPAVVQV